MRSVGILKTLAIAYLSQSLLSHVTAIPAALPHDAPTSMLVTNPTTDDPKTQDRHADLQNVECNAYVVGLEAGYRAPPEKSIESCHSYCGNAGVDTAHGNITSVMCVAGGDNVPVFTDKDGHKFMQGVCKCNVGFVDELVDDVVKSLALFGEITCEIFFGALTSVLELGALAIPGVGELDAADVGMQVAVRGAEAIANRGGDALTFLNWFGGPCNAKHGKFSASPENIFLPLIGKVVPKGLPKGLPKGDKPGNRGSPPKATEVAPPRSPDPPKEANKPKPPEKTAGTGPPKEAGKPRTAEKPTQTHKPEKTSRTSQSHSSTTSHPACKIKRGEPEFVQQNSNTWRSESCKDGKTDTFTFVANTIKYQEKKRAVTGVCKDDAIQACYHYRSAIAVQPKWAHLACPTDAATPPSLKINHRKHKGLMAQGDWVRQHPNSIGHDKKPLFWTDKGKTIINPSGKPGSCEADEFPPAYLLDKNDEAAKKPLGQLVRWIPGIQNTRAGNMWQGICFEGAIEAMERKELEDQLRKHKPNPKRPDLEIDVSLSAAQPVFEMVFPGLEEGNTHGETGPAKGESGGNGKGKGKAAKPNEGKEIEATFRRGGSPGRERRGESSKTNSGDPSKKHGREIDDGLAENPCVDHDLTDDPRFALLDWDPAYASGSPSKYNYKAQYEPGPRNGKTGGVSVASHLAKYAVYLTKFNTANVERGLSLDIGDLLGNGTVVP